MDTGQIEKILKEALELDEVHVSGENAHFNVVAVSEKFSSLGRVKQQQLIYAPLMEFITSNEIHALTIKTFTPEQWKKSRLLNG